MQLFLFKRFVVCCFLFSVLGACQSDLPVPANHAITDQSGAMRKTLENRYVVVLKEGVGGLKVAQDSKLMKEQLRYLIGEMLGMQSMKNDRIAHIYSSGFIGFSAYLSEGEYKKLSQLPEVASIEKDQEITFRDIEPKINQSAYAGRAGSVPGDLVPYGVERVGGPLCYTGKNVVYVVDSGIDLQNEELNVNVSRGFNAIYTGEESSTLQDFNGHGTHVAGIIGAKMDGKGIVGVAAGATVIPIKIVDKDGRGTYSGILAALDHIMIDGCKGDVVNVSLTGPVTPVLETSIEKASDKGINFVFAAGNESDHAKDYSPGRLNGKYFFTVSAMDENDVFAEFSNYGNPPIDWCAPGVGVLSTWINGQYNFRSGTSYAAPHVAALILQGGPVKDGLVKNDPDGDCDPIAVRKCP
ncbi:S8 family serine peptidase [Echinicola rosea]|uniref:Peptidase inhibitor I9 n=1 Tax=Echinicola rosea TaxID=1807691 RepID=A0ABQ1V906_9BACT|nr:S8 family serine peptidase [Echinicola rosea]GGF45260.1 hypothetical protein GCM10011339_37170 [Echinicola rosea]